MPLYIHLANLIVLKSAIELKYSGGLEKFREDYSIANENHNQEDDELFLIARMNVDEIDIEGLIKAGLDYDRKLMFSNDFVIKPRYGDYSWEVNWIEDNSIFAWHIETDPELINVADRICNMPIDQIGEFQLQGVNLLSTIKSENDNDLRF